MKNSTSKVSHNRPKIFFQYLSLKDLSNFRYFRFFYIQNQITCWTVAVTIFFILSKSTHYCNKAWCNEVGYQNCQTELNEFWFASGYVLMWTLWVFLGILILIVRCSLLTTLKDLSNSRYLYFLYSNIINVWTINQFFMILLLNW